MDKKYTSIRGYKETSYNLKLLAALRRQSITETLHELVSEALAEEEAKRATS